MKQTRACVLPLYVCGWFLFSFLALTLAASAPGTDLALDITAGWKFMAGDNPAYSRPDWDDSTWIPFKVDHTWEDQGYESLDGYAWFRLRVVIPSRLKEKAHLKDGLRLFLGKINNFDQTFLNGKLAGVNNVLTQEAPADGVFIKADRILYNQERTYILPFDDARIKWDQENVIAVRVFDEGGLGGIYSGGLTIRPVQFQDYVGLDFQAQPFICRDNNVDKTMHLANRSTDHTFQGTLTIDARGKLDDRTVFSKEHPVTLKPNETLTFQVALADMNQAAQVTYRLACPKAAENWSFTEESPYILTPPVKPEPRLNSPLVYGARPDKPFLFTIPASGARPMTFSAQGLPPGLSLDEKTGIIRGRVSQPGEYNVRLSARNELGQSERGLRLIIGDKIALTPPLGWNSWNCWGLSVDTDKVLTSARVFKEKGLMDHGWSYINIDDGWEIFGDDPRPKRDEQGNILTNEKFPDMKGLGDRLHDLGLKFGIYSSPGPLTCGGYTASYQHEFQDARSFASWGIDYLKYDWCSYNQIAPERTPEQLRKPYILMRQALDSVDRDIVFSLCQYGMGKVWEWGAEVGGNLWRTTGDIEDTWKSLSEIGFNQVENAPYAGPGHWNDPDMLVVGWVGWGPNLHPSRLTPDEQYTHISLWCLLSAPLLIGCDLDRLDPFTLNLLCNDEVLAIDQDPLGQAAIPKIKTGTIQVWVKKLADGQTAIGIFNLGESRASFKLDFSAIGLPGKVSLRNLWTQEDLGTFKTGFSTPIASHGAVLLKTI